MPTVFTVALQPLCKGPIATFLDTNGTIPLLWKGTRANVEIDFLDASGVAMANDDWTGVVCKLLTAAGGTNLVSPKTIAAVDFGDEGDPLCTFEFSSAELNIDAGDYWLVFYTVLTDDAASVVVLAAGMLRLVDSGAAAADEPSDPEAQLVTYAEMIAAIDAAIAANCSGDGGTEATATIENDQCVKITDTDGTTVLGYIALLADPIDGTGSTGSTALTIEVEDAENFRLLSGSTVVGYALRLSDPVDGGGSSSATALTTKIENDETFRVLSGSTVLGYIARNASAL